MDKNASLLNDVRVTSPCAADWNSMFGDDQVRSCAQCQKKVYNLSEMTAAEAADFVRRAEGRVCVRFHRRADGTMLTRDHSAEASAPPALAQTAHAAPSPLRGLARRAGMLGLTMASAATLAHANPPQTAEKPLAAHKAPAASTKAKTPVSKGSNTPAILSALPSRRQAMEPETVAESATPREDAIAPPTVYSLLLYTTQGELAALPAASPTPVLHGEAFASNVKDDHKQ